MNVDDLITELASLSIAIRLSEEQSTATTTPAECKRAQLKADYFRALHGQLLDNLQRIMHIDYSRWSDLNTLSSAG